MDRVVEGEIEIIDLDEGEDRKRVDGLEDESAARSELAAAHLDQLFEVSRRKMFDHLGGKNASQRAVGPVGETLQQVALFAAQAFVQADIDHLGVAVDGGALH